MHRSRISTLMIDCLDARFDDSLAFWAGALGLKPPRAPAAGQRYVSLGELESPLCVRVQRVSSNPGYHLDLETDGMRAEVQRLERLGAHRKYRIKRWWVMEDPSGNAFCVIRPESAGFPDNANIWSGNG